jgi:glyceraldehyde 3-phosphate dehydrogenase
MSFRVPTSDVSVVDLTVRTEQGSHLRRDLRRDEGPEPRRLKGVLGYTEDKVVATDFRGETCTSVFDADAGIALDGTFVKVVAWYDNEWGYSNKCLEMVRVVAKGACRRSPPVRTSSPAACRTPPAAWRRR